MASLYYIAHQLKFSHVSTNEAPHFTPHTVPSNRWHHFRGVEARRKTFRTQRQSSAAQREPDASRSRVSLQATPVTGARHLPRGRALNFSRFLEQFVQNKSPIP